MLKNLLALINMEGSLGFGEACIYALIGFAIVFAGIMIIIFIIWLIGLLMKKTDNLAFLTVWSNKMAANKAERVAKRDAKRSAKTVGDSGGAAQNAAAQDEVPDEIKAAIVAAIACYYTAQSPKCEFKVKRIKRM